MAAYRPMLDINNKEIVLQLIQEIKKYYPDHDCISPDHPIIKTYFKVLYDLNVVDANKNYSTDSFSAKQAIQALDLKIHGLQKQLKRWKLISITSILAMILLSLSIFL